MQFWCSVLLVGKERAGQRQNHLCSKIMLGAVACDITCAWCHGAVRYTAEADLERNVSRKAVIEE